MGDDLSLPIELQGKKVELYLRAEKIRVLSCSMIEPNPNDLPDRGILHSIILDTLKPYLPEGDYHE